MRSTSGAVRTRGGRREINIRIRQVCNNNKPIDVLQPRPKYRMRGGRGGDFRFDCPCPHELIRRYARPSNRSEKTTRESRNQEIDPREVQAVVRRSTETSLHPPRASLRASLLKGKERSSSQSVSQSVRSGCQVRMSHKEGVMAVEIKSKNNMAYGA